MSATVISATPTNSEKTANINNIIVGTTTLKQSTY
jgi:hypothetical protein